MEIKDGTGTGNRLKITDEHQALVQSEVETEASHHAKLGHTFLVGSDFVVYNVSTETTVLQITNTSTTKNIYIGYLRTCNQDAGMWRLYTGTTGFTNSTTPSAYNMYTGSASSLDATIVGGSVTPGTYSSSTYASQTQMAQWIQSTHSISPFDGSFILAPNDEFSMSFEPFTGTVNNVACITLQVWQY